MQTSSIVVDIFYCCYRAISLNWARTDRVKGGKESETVYIKKSESKIVWLHFENGSRVRVCFREQFIGLK